MRKTEDREVYIFWFICTWNKKSNLILTDNKNIYKKPYIFQRLIEKNHKQVILKKPVTQFETYVSKNNCTTYLTHSFFLTT